MFSRQESKRAPKYQNSIGGKLHKLPKTTRENRDRIFPIAKQRMEKGYVIKNILENLASILQSYDFISIG